MTDLSRIGDREKLKARKGDEPHWQRLRHGCYLGFRPSKRGGKGKWFARAYHPDEHVYKRKALGDYSEMLGHDVFKQAKEDAEKFADTVESGGVAVRKLVTVEDACRAYAEGKPREVGNLERTVYSDPIASVKLDKLRRHHLRSWRTRLEEKPALVTRNKGGETRTRVRAKSTVNRDMVPLRAALSQVLSPGAPNTDAAWQEALKPHRGAGKRRDLYLDRDERKLLLKVCDKEAEPFVRALCLLPLRPGSLANLKVRDFDRRTRSLTIGKDKNGKPRQITVPESIATFLEAQSKDKLPTASIFARASGAAWDKNTWKVPIKDAVREAGLPDAVAAYTLRHSVLTDLIRAKLPILTVAQLAGTGVEMIEKHYGHLVRDDAEDALASLAL
ncbi:tyrosine-type recombinase/integrase [Tsuneonella sp. SYSU-LHT278]|uniref:tyrosine-type recombinase/integrase n=1 Tax=Tsuneonella sediminis TaxID=3416089 RepID=UPI003F798487